MKRVSKAEVLRYLQSTLQLYVCHTSHFILQLYEVFDSAKNTRSTGFLSGLNTVTLYNLQENNDHRHAIYFYGNVFRNPK